MSKYIQTYFGMPNKGQQRITFHNKTFMNTDPLALDMEMNQFFSDLEDTPYTPYIIKMNTAGVERSNGDFVVISQVLYQLVQ